MLPAFILPEQSVDTNGSGDSFELSDDTKGILLLTLGITDVVEQESLDVLIKGSVNGEEWDDKALQVFPQKFYRGTSALLLDLRAHPEVRYLRTDWLVHRWGVGSKTPMFRFYLHAEVFTGFVAP
jgi:hypothetical protein